MGNELILPENYKQTYDNIVKMIETAKHKVFETANFQTVYLFWHAQYLTAMPPKKELEEKLRLAIQRAKIQLEQRKE